MLQIIIMHESNSTKISEIRDLETMTSIASFDKKKNCTDLSVLRPHVDEQILVTHFVKDKECTRLDYESVRTLTQVGTDNNGFMYIQYN